MNLEQVLRAKFRKVKKAKGASGLELRICCPFCPETDRKYHMYINPQKEVYNCWRCHKSGTLRSLLGELYSSDFQQERAMAVQRDEPLPEDIMSPGLTVPVNSLDSVHPAIEYLTRIRKRTFDANELFTSFGVRYCTHGDKIHLQNQGCDFDTTNTLVFPVWMFGKIVGWQSRLMYDPDKLDDSACEALAFRKDEDGDWCRPPKYLTSPGFKKGRVLYNFDLARKYEYVVVTEGVFDAMSAGPCAVATFGTGISEQQCRLLKSYWQTVIIMLDPDGTDQATEDLYNELHRAVNVVHVKLKGYKDPGDCPRDEIWRQVSATARNLRLTEKTLVLEGITARQVDKRDNMRKLWTLVGKK